MVQEFAVIELVIIIRAYHTHKISRIKNVIDKIIQLIFTVTITYYEQVLRFEIV